MLVDKLFCVVLASFGTILTIVSNHILSRYTFRQEVKKLSLTWDHEDTTSNSKTFTTMAGIVSIYLRSHTQKDQDRALMWVAVARSNFDGALGDTLDSLYSALHAGDVSLCDELLTRAILNHRKCKPERIV